MTSPSLVLRSFRALAASALIALAACGDPTPDASIEKTEEAPAPAPAAEALQLTAVGFESLPGWTADPLDDAPSAFLRSCARLTLQPDERPIGTDAAPVLAGDFDAPCAAAAGLESAAPADKRAFFETHFRPFLAADAADGDEQGLFTGYFEAELTGARTRSETYATPLYSAPPDLVVADLSHFDPDLAGRRLIGRIEDGRFVPYPDRGAIEGGLLDGRDLELLWIDDPVDVFLLQVQGSGRVILPDGEVVRVGFAAHNGRPYRSIGRVLIERGALAPHAASWDGIRGWIEDNPEAASALFAENPRFVFFRLLEGEDGPIGAQGVALTPERSLAVDRRYVPLGAPVWLDATMPGDTDAPLRRLMVAQDAGGAINGPVRGDFFWGYGDAALAMAGKMKSRGRYFLLLPKASADRMTAAAAGS
ncbi:MAG: MltA domain-containing protein [Marivibrio sp.]|uniref:murein transglycosylase A n=1 Tax=Marivibrio sp. TaxID=2039719 RepID=UPI0032EEF655